MNPIPLIKFIGAWFFLIAAVVFVVLGHQPFGLPGVLALISIAFSQAPASWA